VVVVVVMVVPSMTSAVRRGRVLAMWVHALIAAVRLVLDIFSCLKQARSVRRCCAPSSSIRDFTKTGWLFTIKDDDVSS